MPNTVALAEETMQSMIGVLDDKQLAVHAVPKQNRPFRVQHLGARDDLLAIFFLCRNCALSLWLYRF